MVIRVTVWGENVHEQKNKVVAEVYPLTMHGTIAAALNLDYRRVQMTPDLLPNDITGSAIFRQNTHEFEFRRGPIFANFLLADEINRASARTQSAPSASQATASTKAESTPPESPISAPGNPFFCT